MFVFFVLISVYYDIVCINLKEKCNAQYTFSPHVQIDSLFFVCIQSQFIDLTIIDNFCTGIPVKSFIILYLTTQVF